MAADNNSAQYQRLIGQFAGKSVLVVGDLMLDEFVWGTVSRISPEAPVPVVKVAGETYYPGGAANVARNLREFTDRVGLAGLTGNDAAGARLTALLESCGIDTAGVQRSESFATIVKTRIIARNQQVVRVDREDLRPASAEESNRAVRYLEGAIAALDAVIIADYNKGFLGQELADRICRLAAARGKVLTVDPHPYSMLTWRGASAVKPNRAEAFLAAGVPHSEGVDPVLADERLLGAGRRLLEVWGVPSVLVTLGEQGMLLLVKDAPPYHTPACAKDVFDVSGAGDTAIAVFTLALSAGASHAAAAELANRASGIVVGKLGTATVSPAELTAAFA